LLPGLSQHAGRLGEDAELTERGVNRDRKVLLEGHELGAVAVKCLDAPFGVAAVAAHVPLRAGAAGARLGIRPAHDAGHQLPGLERRPVRRLAHAPQQLMTEDQLVALRRRLAVAPVDDLPVGAADTEPQRLDQQFSGVRPRLLDLTERGTAWIARHDGDGLHACGIPRVRAEYPPARWTSGLPART
jgi:hypothetical protein